MVNKKTVITMGITIAILVGIIIGMTIGRQGNKTQVASESVARTKQVTETVVPAKEVFTKEHINNMNKMCNEINNEIDQLFLVATKMKAGDITTKKQLLDEYTRIDNDMKDMINNDFSSIKKSDNETRDGGIDLAIKIAKDLDTSVIKIKAALNQQNIDMTEYGNQYDFIASTRDNVKKMQDALEKAK